jgi:hypothetical protein
MSEEKPIDEQLPEKAKPAGRRKSRSAFAPIMLIAAGVFFLLDNLGVVADLDWSAAFRFWPLLLIFIGLDVLVTQIRPPLGSALSALVALTAAGALGYLLLAGSPDSTLRALGMPPPPELKEESFAISSDSVESAAITLDLANMASDIGASRDGSLITGTIWTRTSLALEQDRDDGRLEVTVGERPGGFVFDPAAWTDEGGRSWRFQLSRGMPIDLHIDAGNAPTTADLSTLTLSELTIDAGNGSLRASLPGGDYEIQVDGGNGSIDLMLPAGVEARVEYDAGNGAVSAGGRLARVDGDSDEGVYETPGYEGAAERLSFNVDSGNGQVSISAP